MGRYVTRIALPLKFLAGFVAATALSVFSPDARTQNCPANVPHLTGTWTVLPYQMPINPISANLLRNGKILIVAGSEADASNNSKGAESYRAAVWDPTGSTENSITIQNLTYDVFCSGTAALEKQIELLKTFADQAVIAIENTRLFNELQTRTQELGRSVERLRSLSEVSQAVNSTLNIEQVLNAIVVRAVQLSSADAGLVYELEKDGRLRSCPP